MLCSRACRWSIWLLAALALPAYGQSVISARSGVVHYFEGAVYLGDQALVSHLGKFPSLPQGAELRTEQGRAEVLLTPGVFLRIGDNTAIRMLANDLADTRVELETGSAMLDAGEPNSGTSVSLIYKDWRIHLLDKGVYRIDSDPPRLSVNEGQAEVFAPADEQPVRVSQGMDLPLAGVLVPEAASGLAADTLSDWTKGRSESIAADNAITAQIDEDPAAQTPGVDSFSYFPLLGVPSAGLSSPGLYSSTSPYQPGFNSIYLPGYTYRPLWLGLAMRGYGTYLFSRPPRIGGYTGIGSVGSLPRPPFQHPAPIHPTSIHPGPGPIHTAPAHVGIGGGHH